MDILFIHRSHPLAGKINSICQQISSQPELQKGEIELEIDPKLSDGMNGSVRISDKILWPVEIISPIKNMKTISKNEVISVCYKYPVSHSHIPRPPEGVVVPETSITKEDHSHLNVLYSEKNPCISQLPRPDSAPFPSPYHIAEVNQSQANGNHSAVVGLGERKTEKKSRKRKRHRRMGKNLGSNSELDNNFEMLKSSFPGEQNNGNAYNADLDGLKDVTTEVVFGEKDLRSEIMKLCEGNKIQSVNVETSVNPSENDVKHQNILIISEQSKADDLFGGSNGALEVKTEVKSHKKEEI
ncbi:uncharacterized protein LOC110812592 [Carica papaya]|uniref:uncharacterized protein LOC110812592 n=1 Tax=Carica papaya TaxID=3649 RepID=UPI000B8CF077|nr:uncharacterized protein LOC110812592 [Carica papaya]